MAAVKVAFSQNLENDSNPTTEFMWINDIDFDGEIIKGVLLNEPNHLTNVKVGDIVEVRLAEIVDWLMALLGKTYGGFTVHVFRSQMSQEEQENHDENWGLDFGSSDDILIVHEEKEHPKNLVEHPMSIGMKEKTEEFLTENPEEITGQDPRGHTMLIDEVIAGNRTMVELLLAKGADPTIKTNTRKTALDFAKLLNWEHIIPILEKG